MTSHMLRLVYGESEKQVPIPEAGEWDQIDTFVKDFPALLSREWGVRPGHAILYDRYGLLVSIRDVKRTLCSPDACFWLRDLCALSRSWLQDVCDDITQTIHNARLLQNTAGSLMLGSAMEVGSPKYEDSDQLAVDHGKIARPSERMSSRPEVTVPVDMMTTPAPVPSPSRPLTSFKKPDPGCETWTMKAGSDSLPLTPATLENLIWSRPVQSPLVTQKEQVKWHRKKESPITGLLSDVPPGSDIYGVCVYPRGRLHKVNVEAFFEKMRVKISGRTRERAWLRDQVQDWVHIRI